MEITEVRIKLMDEAGDRLKGFCSITLDDCFVVRDLKIIEGNNGPFVAMPSRKLTSRCPQCSNKNHLKAAYCNQCGLRLKDDRAIKDESGRAKLYADIAHPINSQCREKIQSRIVEEFHEECERAKQPGYVSRYDDFDLDDESYRTSHVSHDSHDDAPTPHLGTSADQSSGQSSSHASGMSRSHGESCSSQAMNKPAQGSLPEDLETSQSHAPGLQRPAAAQRESSPPASEMAPRMPAHQPRGPHHPPTHGNLPSSAAGTDEFGAGIL